MKLDPAKALVTAGVIALGISGGVAMAAYAPTLSTAAAGIVGGALNNYTQNGGPHGADPFSAAAAYIGISVDQLKTELGTDKSLADVAVAHGKTRDGLIQALVSAAQANITTLVDEKGIGAHRGPAGAPGMGLRLEGNPLAAAATYLGISEADLRTKLESGQTLAQIAGATAGKSRDGLIAALASDATAKIDAAQKAGTITADQATQMKANLTQMFTQLVDATHPPRPFGFGR
jgi:hypothetical protein